MTLIMNENKVNIRKANKGDVDRIHNLVQRAFSNYDTKGSNPALNESLMDIEYDIRNNIVIILETEGKMLGSLRLDFEDGTVHLKRFSIDPDYQAKGIGTILYQRAEEEVKKRNYNSIYLYASLENEKVIRFYKKLGFKCIKSDRNNSYLRGLWIKKVK